MTVSIRSVLHNTQFKRADPVVEVEGKDLDTPVRWVFTNEREDVSSFLSGGEMLIIEGNALLAADWHGTLGQYVASLHRLVSPLWWSNWWRVWCGCRTNWCLRPGCMG